MSVQSPRKNDTYSKNSFGVAPESDAARRAIPYDTIESTLRGIRYGVVQIIIQDGVVIQIDKTEKIRLSKTTE